jgi:hypothetical protein
MDHSNQQTNLIKILLVALLATGLLTIAMDVVTVMAAVSWN